MKINGVDFQPNINPVAGGKNDQVQRVDGMSFLDMMKLRTLQGASQVSQVEPVAQDSSALPALNPLSEIEAIAARSRVQYVSKGDVSDFLELVKQKAHLLDGFDLSALSESGGGHILTDGEAAALRQKYDVSGMTPEEQYKLLDELTGLGAVSKSDAQKLQATVSADETDLMGYLSKEPGFSDIAAISGNQPLERLNAMISNERYTYDHVQDRYGQRCTSVKELADSHQRVSDVLNRLMRREEPL